MQNDLISRSALKSFLCKCCNVLHSDEPCEPSDCNVMGWVDELPSVDAADRQKLIGKLFPLGVPLTREDWNYSINAKAVYEAIMRTEG